MTSIPIKQLQNIVGSEHVLCGLEDLQCYSYDGTGMEYMPEAVVLPENANQISAVMKLAASTPFPVVPRGAGSGMTGGSLPIKGGVVLGLARLNKILEIDSINQLAVVEPGVITGQLQHQVKACGLFYPPDPASLKFCTIGGNVAECAGGPSAVKYGVTRDYIKGLEVVLANGNIITTGVRTDKGVVGYDLTRLFVGSEGTLGIVTKIIVRLLPLPETKTTILVQLNSIQQAADLVAKILSSFTPCTLEYMDSTAIDIVADKIPFPLNSAINALLLIELDGSNVAVASEGDLLTTFLTEQPGVLDIRQAKDKTESEQLWTARRAVSPSAFQLHPDKISEDVVVPRSHIPQLVTYAQQLAHDLNLTIFTFGHAGDGNIHVNIMLDKSDKYQAKAGASAKDKIFAKVVELCGTISGEHGIGITKARAMGLEIDPQTIQAMQLIKQAFDPDNILNPGKIFPQNG